MMVTTSIKMEHDLYEIIKERAKHNRRSVSQEINWLVETGLASGNEQLKELMRFLHRADEPRPILNLGP